MLRLPKGVTFTSSLPKAYERVLTADAVAFVAELHRAFDPARQALLARRVERSKAFAKGELPDFLSETRAIRGASWRIAPVPHDLQDRRVEITAPTERKAMISALNSTAKVYVADFEDLNSPTWDNMVQGQINLMDRWTSAMAHTDPDTGKRQALGQKAAVVMVRPRGLHLNEVHMRVDGKPVSGSLFDFGLYVFRNAATAVAKGSGPYASLPKLESHREARLWNDIFIWAQSALGLPLGTIRASAVIETLPAAFEMDEIIFELRDHMAGLSFGRWNLAFSFIKTLSASKANLLPDREHLTLSGGFLAAIATLMIQTCHRRGCHATGALSVQLPIRKDPEAHQLALDAVKAETERAARNGHDGNSVVHADLVPVALKVFNDMMPTPNQFYVSRDEVAFGQKQLLEIAKGQRTEAGFRADLRIAVHAIESWLRGRGAVAVDHQLEDTAAAELSRALVWQGLKFGVKLDDGPKLTPAFFDACLADEVKQLKLEIGGEAYAGGRFKEAIALFKAMVTAKDFEPFLTTSAYRRIQ